MDLRTWKLEPYFPEDLTNSGKSTLHGSKWKPIIYYAVNLHGIGKDQTPWFPDFIRV